MNGPQDLGGQMGFGPVVAEENEPVFHAGWERRALGLVVAAGAMGNWNIDANRFARESRNPADYFASSYYEIWIKGLERLLLEHGFVTDADLRAGRPIDPAPAPNRIFTADMLEQLVAKGTPFDRPVETPPRFSVGQAVRTRNINPTSHTRLPRYARGRLGVVAGVHGGYVFPDTNARYAGEAPQHLYTVSFTAAELWGDDADANSDVSIDAWESYLEPA